MNKTEYIIDVEENENGVTVVECERLQKVYLSNSILIRLKVQDIREIFQFSISDSSFFIAASVLASLEPRIV